MNLAAPDPLDPAPAPLILFLDELQGRVGETLGYSSWHLISQKRVNEFADATEDHQWIHVDPDRAVAGPFGHTIAHGYLTLSLGPVLLQEVLEVAGAGLIVNYGANRIRFPAPVPVGSSVRAGVQLLGVEEVAGGIQAALGLTFEIDTSPKPACVAEILFRYYRATPPEPSEPGTPELPERTDA
jgi:acyl dehydratase